MKVISEGIKIGLIAIFALVFVGGAIVFSAFLGYFFGIVLEWTTGWLIDINIGSLNTPTIMAWIFVLATVVKTGAKLNDD